MAKINAELEQQIRSMPDQLFNLIVRTYGDAAPHLEWCREVDVAIKQQFRLSPALAVTCSGAVAVLLLEQEWVKSIELDQTVRTM
ncbi:MAG: hypothetical protein KDI62_23205 [Anaerolineae bacterium]|nr:hypothetical protein [Anaerolineae bacterium]MCB9106192.1 hypothetical protein [Anaerolineales bacterium]